MITLKIALTANNLADTKTGSSSRENTKGESMLNTLQTDRKRGDTVIRTNQITGTREGNNLGKTAKTTEATN